MRLCQFHIQALESCITQWNSYFVVFFLSLHLHESLIQGTDSWILVIAEVVHSSFASKILGRDRFVLICSFFDINDNRTYYIPFGKPDHKIFAKVQAVEDSLRGTFGKLYSPQNSMMWWIHLFFSRAFLIRGTLSPTGEKNKSQLLHKIYVVQMGGVNRTDQ